MDWANKTRLAAFNQKFKLVSESYKFSYEIFILGGDIAQNACPYIYALGSKIQTNKAMSLCVAALDSSDQQLQNDYQFSIQILHIKATQ